MKNRIIYNPVVFIIEDDSEVRSALSWLLSSVSLRIRTYENAVQFLEANDHFWPGCIITDVRMPGISGMELLDELAKRHNNLPVIMVTGHGDVPMAVRAMKAGVFDFILKPFNDQQLLDIIYKAISYSIDRTPSQTYADFKQRMNLLTPREREILSLIVAGKINKQISSELEIAISTVELHRSKLMHKLQVKTLAELIRCYLSDGAVLN